MLNTTLIYFTNIVETDQYFPYHFIDRDSTHSIVGVGFKAPHFKSLTLQSDILGLDVQNFVSLTLSLSPQFVNNISTSKANTLLFSLKKCENPLQCKGFSHFFNKKYKCICNIAI